MPKLIDLIGKRFGKLIVIKREYPNGGGHQVKYLCKCDCGTEKIILGESLRNRLTKSCGCFRREKTKLRPGLANMRRLIIDYKASAIKRGLEWGLTEKQFFEITQQDCYYCGAKPNTIKNVKKSNGEYIFNGIDRVNNIKGYIVDNIVPCCKICNNAKRQLTLQEYEDWIKRSYNKLTQIKNERRLIK